MRRRLAMLLSAALVASLTMLAPASPAAANQDVCAGQGVAHTGPLFYPFIDPYPRTVGFAFGFSLVSACATKLVSLSAWGTAAGWCGHSIGRGTTNNGHTFAWTSAGSTLILTGGLVGYAIATPNVYTNQSCLVGATEFLVTLVVVKATHCNTSKAKTMTQPNTFNGLPFPGTSAKVCTDL